MSQIDDLLGQTLGESYTDGYVPSVKVFREMLMLVRQCRQAGYVTDEGLATNPRQIGEAVARHYRPIWGVGNRAVPATEAHGVGLSRECFLDAFDNLPQLLAASKP